MSAKLVVTCDGCGATATVLADATLGLYPLPLGWIGGPIDRPPWLIHACKPACRALVELKYPLLEAK